MKKRSKEPIKIMSWKEDVKRLLMVAVAAFIMALNLKSFVQAGGLVPGGFNGLTLLIQRSAAEFFGLTVSFSLINFLLNVIPAVVCYKAIGKKFTIFSCIMIVLTSVLTDVIPSIEITNDVLLVCIFGGIINGLAIGICLMGKATSGGTDFIACYLSEKHHVDAWNYILVGNALMLFVAGFLFGWDKALYSIIFQFASIQVVHVMNIRYKKATLFIISDKTEEIYQKIKELTNHGATVFKGIGLYRKEERNMIYTVISEKQVKEISRIIREVDKKAFINIIRTDQVEGKFYLEPND